MALIVSRNGLIALPKAAREAAGIQPGDKVIVRALPEGGLLIQREPSEEVIAEHVGRIDCAVASLGNGAVDRSRSSDQWMKLLRD